MRAVEAFTQGVEGAGADVTVDDTERREGRGCARSGRVPTSAGHPNRFLRVRQVPWGSVRGSQVPAGFGGSVPGFRCAVGVLAGSRPDIGEVASVCVMVRWVSFA